MNITNFLLEFLIIFSIFASLTVITSTNPVKYFRKILIRDKLPNSRDTLKVLIPNYNLKVISGWTNHSSKVISQNIFEKKMGYRGTKSNGKKSFVQVQRVDGNWYMFHKILYLRRTLMGCESNYQVKIPSKQVIKNFHSSFSTTSCLKNSLNNLDPFFILGFTDAEGSFYIAINRNNNTKIGWKVQAVFSITLHKRDLPLLKKIQTFFGIGKIYQYGETVSYKVTDLNKIVDVLLPFYNNYSLLSQKLADFLLFKKAVELIKKKEHLKITGLKILISIKASMNKGLSSNLSELFPNIKPVERPKIETKKIPDPNWIAGFSSGESCFDVKLAKNKQYKIAYQTQVRFRISQHNRDEALLKLILSYFNCGKIYFSRKVAEISIESLQNINDKIIPFFNKYPIQGCKNLDYLDFCKVAFLMKNKLHLTKKGINQIKEIKSRMNSNRQHNLDLD